MDRYPGQQEVERTLIREVLGWRMVEPGAEPDGYPAAFWSSSRRCFCVVRRPGESPRPFSPATCLRDALEVQERLETRGFRPVLARPAFDGAVRLVADVGSAEIVCECRCLPRAIAAALYRAVDDGLI